MSTELHKAAAVMGRKGGFARAKSLTKAEIIAGCRKAGLASARKRKLQRKQEGK